MPATCLLKGALLFSLWYDQPKRPTRDADLLGFGADDTATAIAVFRDICKIQVEDGIGFDPNSVKGAEIRKEAGYGGVRIELLGILDGAFSAGFAVALMVSAALSLAGAAVELRLTSRARQRSTVVNVEGAQP